MVDPRVNRLAQLLVGHCARVKEGHKVAISGTTLAAPLLSALYRESLRAGGLPTLLLDLPDGPEILYRMASDAQLTAVDPVQRLIAETYDRQFYVMSEENTKALSNVDTGKQARRTEAQQPLMEASMRRTAEGTLRWNVCCFPTAAYAQDAGLSVTDFADFVFNACLLDHEDPAAAWTEVSQRQQRLVEYLAGKREIHIAGPETDLRLSVAGRTWINDAGEFNTPGGEIITGPVEDSAEGYIRFAFPAMYDGRQVEDVRLRFERGRVVEASARSNEEFLRHMLDMDEGARALGEFAFGTNPNIRRFTGNTLFDEKIGGTVHLALGASYPETGGRNQSSLHWDMVCDLRPGSQVRVDDALFARDGTFVV